MAFKLTNAADNSVLHENTLSAEDYSTIKEFDGEWMEMDLPIGKMRMKQWIFDGVRMGYSDCLLKKPASFNWEGDMDVITMYYSLKGSVSIGCDPSRQIVLGNNEQNIFYGKEAGGFMKVDEMRMKSFIVQFNTEAFLKIAVDGTDSLKYFADQVALNKTCSFSEKALSIDLDVQNAINAIVNCKFNDSLKRVFFLSKAMELLVLQADAHARSASQKSSFVKSDYDRDRIVFARDYMLQHMDMPPTIPELAKIAGINEFKLKKGYKEIFGTTIFGHLAEARLQMAKEALQEGKKSISAIAFDLGYSSVQHFSVSFRKRFGITPRQVK